MKLRKLISLLLTLAMVLPMAVSIVPVSAEETTVEEIPTATLEAQQSSDEEIPTIQQWNFSDEADLEDFDLYSSSDTNFTVSDGVLIAGDAASEQKAILNKDISAVKSVSVNLIPGESGTIYGGIYVGASDPTTAVNGIDSMVFLIKSDYTGWSDAPNRIDIVQGRFDGSWHSISTTISETGNGNNLFSGGNKEALNLKLVFSEDVILLTLSLASNPDKNLQLMYEVDSEDLQGSFGLRAYQSDTKFDRFKVNEDYIPESLHSGLKLDGAGLDSYGKTLDTLAEKPVTIETWVRMDQRSESGRQAIIANYTGSSLATNSQGTWGLYTDEDGDIWFTERCGGSTYNYTERVEMWTSEWTHIAIVRGDGVLRTYANGELINERTSALMGESTVLDNYLTIGYCTVGAGTLKGEIGDIRLWSDERTQAEIQANMYKELTGAEEGLIQHWNFDSQEKGVVSNTVSGGLDVELLGHTQIGNEEIRRWDFSDATQLEDFTFYYSTESTSLYEFELKNEALYANGSINYSSQDVKAVLNEKIDNVIYMGADVTQGGTSTANTGMLVGIKSINSPELYDYEGYKVWLTRCRTSSARRPWGETFFSKMSSGTRTDLTSSWARNETFFPGADVKMPFHIQVEFDGNVATSLMYRLDDPTINVSETNTFADGELEGQIGLALSRTSVYFDNYTVVSEVIEEETKVVEDSVRYDNEGHCFHTESRSWKLTEDLTATPYTLEAWVKIPEGVDDGDYGYIVGNASRAPSVSMQMAPGGKLQLAYIVENADLTVSTATYDVDTDLRNGRWTHVAYTIDVTNDTVVAYINGVAVTTWTNAGLSAISIPDHITPSNTFAIGSLEDNDDPANKLLGWIADVRMWDHALSAEEIKASMLTQYTTTKDGLLFNAPLSEKVSDVFEDISGYGYTVAAYDSALILEAETHDPGAYSMVVIPDQQILSHYSPERLNAMYQWIADNRERENIQIVMNVGDMADNCGNLDQWANTKAAVALLGDLPFIAAPGNHDYDTNSGWNKGYGVRDQLTLMNEYLPRSLFESYSTEIGFFDEVNSANQWQAFTVNDNRYLILALEYVPQDDVIAWANEVVENHPNHQVILVTHSYVGSYGNLDVPKLWTDFVSKHENIIMAFSGHVWHTTVVRRTDEGENGNQVHQMLMDAQVSDTGSEGNKYAAMIGILRFNADGTVCDVSYYSTDRDMYDTTSNFTLNIAKNDLSYKAKVGNTFYTTINEAIKDADGQVVTIDVSTDEAVTVNTDVTIDLAGYSLSNVTVSEGAKLSLVDSASTYETAGGSAAVNGDVEMLTELDGRKYMVIGEDDVYAAHRYYAGLTHTTLNTANTGFGYKAQYKGDETVQAQVASIGYQLWIDGGRVVTRSQNGFKNSLTLLLKNFDIEKHGETVVYARIFMTLANGETVYGATHSSSMRQMVQGINASYADFSVGKLQAVAALISQHETMQGWEVANILAASTEES